jgi:hypothetical protein
MDFGLYEAGGEDETFILVDVQPTYEAIEQTQRSRRERRIEQHIGSIAEQRIVPLDIDEEFPLHADVEGLSCIIRANNDAFPK